MEQQKSRIHRTIENVTSEGRLEVASKEVFHKINFEMGEVFSKAKNLFEEKEKASRKYLSDLLSGAINFYKDKRFYRRVADYFL